MGAVSSTGVAGRRDNDPGASATVESAPAVGDEGATKVNFVRAAGSPRTSSAASYAAKGLGP
jgi:hypothetical protein